MSVQGSGDQRPAPEAVQVLLATQEAKKTGDKEGSQATVQAFAQSAEEEARFDSEVRQIVDNAKAEVVHLQKWAIMYQMSLSINALVEAVENAMKKAIESAFAEQEALDKEISSLKSMIVVLEKQIGEIQKDLTTLKSGTPQEKDAVLRKHGRPAGAGKTPQMKHLFRTIMAHNLSVTLCQKLEDLQNKINAYTKNMEGKENEKKKAFMEFVNGTLSQMIALLMALPEMLDALFESMEQGFQQSREDSDQARINGEVVTKTLAKDNPQVGEKFASLEESRDANREAIAIEILEAAADVENLDVEKLERAYEKYAHRSEGYLTDQALLVQGYVEEH